MKIYRTLDRCAMCASTALARRLELAPIPIATPNRTLPAGMDAAEALRGVPLDLVQCERCGHVQVGVVGEPEFQYRDYVYTTTLSLGLQEHFAAYAASLMTAVAPGALVIDIGSNDGTLLRHFRDAGARVLGVDPATAIAAQATAAGIPTVPEFFGLETARRIRSDHGPASLILANNMIANVPDLIDFAAGIAELLAPDGRFVFETQYGADVIERTLVDTIYHEHVSYFLMKPAAAWMRDAGLEAIDVLPIPTKGGSMRVTVQRAGGPHATSGNVERWIAEEEARGAFAEPFFAQLGTAIAAIRGDLHALVAAEQSAGRAVAGFGVSIGTTTMLAQFGLHDAIAFLCDDDPKKDRALIGPGYEIPVVPPAALVERRPGACIIFAWRYSTPILAHHSDYLGTGGRFVVPLPSVRAIAGTPAAAP